MAANGTASGSGTTSFADRVMERLIAWPGVWGAPAVCGVGAGFLHISDDRQFLHLHAPNEAQLLLTRPVIARLRKPLVETGRVTVQPGGEWVAVGLHTDTDVALVVALSSVAIKAVNNIIGTRQPRCGAADRLHLDAGGARTVLRRWTALLGAGDPRRS
ncbi:MULTISPECIES: luciferase domain-containing protein [Thermomonospora]|uniref:Luciferase domain-containing protein n=1 Tax=Thermomonospora cellulosilytica TaxID=1411118 RepID=A0A7W3N035_9ACTN|nr:MULTISPECIES: luciferase family protein [Thermomonospora]MBA9005081.1 hypothetical protein [Thermomonospora cellulosilytica]